MNWMKEFSLAVQKQHLTETEADNVKYLKGENNH